MASLNGKSLTGFLQFHLDHGAQLYPPKRTQISFVNMRLRYTTKQFALASLKLDSPRAA